MERLDRLRHALASESTSVTHGPESACGRRMPTAETGGAVKNSRGNDSGNFSLGGAHGPVHTRRLPSGTAAAILRGRPSGSERNRGR